MGGYLNITVHTDDNFIYGKDYDKDTICKEIEKIKGVEKAVYKEPEPLTDGNWSG